MAWMTAAEALEVLQVRPQTLYANVSRGKVRARPDERDPRRSLYHRDDVLRMARRSNGRRKVDAVSAQAMQYGDPVLATALSTAAGGRLLYRGLDAADLSNTATLEDIAALLWDCDAQIVRAGTADCANVRTPSGSSTQQLSPDSASYPPAPDSAMPKSPPRSALAAGLLALAERSASDAPSLVRPVAQLQVEAAGLLGTVAAALIGQAAGEVARPTDGQVHQPPDETPGKPAIATSASISTNLAHAWHCAAHEDLLRRALVLMADHELNASTFATRVAISTGASLASGLLAGLATLTGPLHGGAPAQLAQLLTLAEQYGAAQAVRQWLASGRALPGFGHPLYPEGDPRAAALRPLLPEDSLYTALAGAAREQAGELPSIDFALALLASTCRLPPDAPFILFALGRCVGWLAHALEQVQTGQLIRPRARYVGPKY